MDGNIKTNKDLGITEDIPIELLQTGIHISDLEVLEHNYLILEENYCLILGIRREPFE